MIGRARVEDGLIATAHHCQHAVFSTGLAAGDRRVDKVGAAGRRCRIEFAGDFGRGGGVVDEDGAGLQGFEGAALAGCHRAQVIVIADAAEDEVGAIGGLRRGWSRSAAELLSPFFGFRGRAVIDRHIVTALDLQVTGHRIPHDAQTNERDFCHSKTPEIPFYRDLADADGVGKARDDRVPPNPASKPFCGKADPCAANFAMIASI